MDTQGDPPGRDVYLLSQLVGPHGHVIGLDMTEEQLALARETIPSHMERFGLEKPNVEFRHGFIEDLAGAGLDEDSVDLVISNCVVNLSPRKDLVLAEVARVLRPGGEFHLSDVVVDRRLPAEVAFDPVLHAECLGGAMVDFDLLGLARRSGFGDPRELSRAPITIQNPAIEEKVAPARFDAVSWRLLALDGLDARCEDYGQVATYRGGIPGCERHFRLDDHHLFEAGRPERVCGNTAAMLSETRFAAYFDVHGDRRTHFGAFPCSETIAQPDPPRRARARRAAARSIGTREASEVRGPEARGRRAEFAGAPPDTAYPPHADAPELSTTPPRLRPRHPTAHTGPRDRTPGPADRTSDWPRARSRAAP